MTRPGLGAVVRFREERPMFKHLPAAAQAALGVVVDRGVVKELRIAGPAGHPFPLWAFDCDVDDVEVIANHEPWRLLSTAERKLSSGACDVAAAMAALGVASKSLAAAYEVLSGTQVDDRQRLAKAVDEYNETGKTVSLVKP